MIDEQREKHREAQRRYRARNAEKVAAAKARYRQANPEKCKAWRRKHVASDPERELFRGFVYRQRKGEEIAARAATWRAENPDRYREQNRAKQQRRNLRRRTECERARNQRRDRLRHIARCADPAALAARIVANVEAVVQRTLPPDVRGPVLAAMVADVYAGELPIRPSRADADRRMRDHFKLFNKYGPQSLDAAMTDGGGTLHDVISEGLWQ